jgi:hypothetical protein
VQPVLVVPGQSFALAPGPTETSKAPVLGAAPPPTQEMAFEHGRSSKKGLVFAAIVALLIAAGLTFAFLKLKGL